MKTDEALVGLAVELFEGSTVRWLACDRVALSDFSVQPSFADLRALEGISLFVERIGSAFGPDLLGIYSSGAEGVLTKESTVALRVPRILSKLVVVKDLDDLLSIDKAKFRLPQYCIVAPDSVQSRAVSFVNASMAIEDVPSGFRPYFRAVQLWDLLDTQDHHKAVSGALLFFCLRRN